MFINQEILKSSESARLSKAGKETFEATFRNKVKTKGELPRRWWVYTSERPLCPRRAATMGNTRHRAQSYLHESGRIQKDRPRGVCCCEPAGLQAARPARCRAAGSTKGKNPNRAHDSKHACSNTHAHTDVCSHACTRSIWSLWVSNFTCINCI